MKIGTTELLLILAVVLVVFGPKNLPKLAKMFGKSAKSFKEGMEDIDDDGNVKTEKAETAAAETKAETKSEE